MKKYRFTALFLATTLFLSLLLPVQAGLVDEMEVKAAAALLVEGDTGEILYEKNKDERRYPASLTKIMTALLTIRALEEGTLEDGQVITVSATAISGLDADGSTQDIKAGEEITVRDLLYCVLVASANEACNILAEAVAGSVDTFVEQMNETAAALGMEGTHFTNPHGLHNDDHYTTAYDIWLMTREAMKYPLFREIVATVDHYVPATNLHDQRHFYNTNALLTSWKYIGYTYRNAIGIKTGNTSQSGQCLVSAAVKGERTLYAVVLGAENVMDSAGKVTDRQSFSESKRLLEWGFDNFARQTILGPMDLQGQVAVTLSKTEQVVAAPAGTLAAMLPKDLEPADFTITPIYDQASVEAPVAKGQKLGVVTVSYGGREYGSLDLVALTDVERDEWMYRKSQLQAFFNQLWVRIILVVLAVLVVTLLVRVLLFGGRRRHGGFRYGGRASRRRYRGRRR